MARFIQQLTTLTALLSSSCCIVQLVLNLFSVSCAGFAVLTPYRSIFTAITVLLMGYNVLTSTARNKGRVWVSLIVSIVLMMSPQVVQWVNRSAPAPSPTTAYYYRIHLDGLGCEACANRIKSTLGSVEWISNAQVYFSNQTAIVETITKENNRLIGLIKGIDAKYDAEVLDSWWVVKRT